MDNSSIPPTSIYKNLHLIVDCKLIICLSLTSYIKIIHYAASYKTFQTRLENIESTHKNSLEERRTHKLSCLTPHSYTQAFRAYTPHKHKRELCAQIRRHGATKGYAPYRTQERNSKGKWQTCLSLSPQVWKKSTPNR